VRRAFLCGTDHYSGRNYDHRKDWVRNRLIELSEIFAIEVCGYAVMSNHLHIIIRNRPDLRDGFSNREIAERWRKLYPKQFNSESSESIREQALRTLMGDPERIATLRARLGSISWFMKSLSEPIARRANREDGCKGRFWEGRFKCQALLDEAAILACMSYVDLNPIRAKIAETPEESPYTSVHDHVEARQAREHVMELQKQHRAKGGKTLTVKQKAFLKQERQHEKVDAWLCPIEDSPKSWKQGIHGLLQMTLDEYLALLDWTGRCIAKGKRGCIPPHLKPILERLQIDCAHWVDTVLSFGHIFHRAVGHVKEVLDAAHRVGLHWFQGLKNNDSCFPEGSPG
jgi:REP element-mobilizing transposase RayT